jgi:hypothetical protein
MMKSMFVWMMVAVSGLHAEILQQETFSDGTADLSWHSVWGEAADQLQVDYQADNPTADGFVGKLGNGLSGGGVGTLVVSNPSLTDYTVWANVRLTPGTTHYRGIVGRVTEVSTDSTSSFGFYALVADLSTSTGMGDERLMLRKWLPGGQAMTNIKVWSRAELGDLYPDDAGWHKLAMRFEGTSITCFIDDQELPTGTWTDTSFSGGGFGVYYFDMTDTSHFLDFDDVTAENETTLAPLPLAPQNFTLHQPWPNPFNPAVHVDMQLNTAQPVRAELFDMTGRLVRVLLAGDLGAGAHRITWDGQDETGLPAASATYLLSVTAGGQSQSRRVTLLR